MDQEQRLNSQAADQFLFTQSNRVNIIPFIKDEVSDKTIEAVFYKMVYDKTLYKVFDGKIATPEEFLKFIKSEENLVIFFSVENIISGFAWLTSINKNFAFAHFCLFKEVWGEIAMDIGYKSIEYWKSFKLFKVILGLINKKNRLAINYIKRLGFVEVGEIPAVVNGQSGILSYRSL